MATQIETLEVGIIKALLCAAVDTASHRHWFQACTVYGRTGTMLKNDTAVPKLAAIN
jgi:hypothetical protein